jgi:hypothetical protein
MLIINIMKMKSFDEKIKLLKKENIEIKNNKIESSILSSFS